MEGNMSQSNRLINNSRRNNKIKDNVIKGLIWTFSLITILFLLWLLIYIFVRGLPHLSIRFLTSPNNRKSDGIFPMIFNTLFIVLASLIVSVPLGIGAAIYMVEYTKPGRHSKVVQTIRFAVETLAGIPSILYGLFGLIFFVTILKFGFSILAGVLTLSIMVLPTIIRTTDEALKSVPNSYREGSLALGASKFYTIKKVVLPTAIPGILTAVILSIGRIVGETAAVYLTAGMGRNIATKLFESGRTLSVHLYILAKEGISFDKAYATAAILIIIIAIINLISSKLAALMKKRG